MAPTCLPSGFCIGRKWIQNFVVLFSADDGLSGHYDVIYKSTQPYKVQVQRHIVPAVGMNHHPHDGPFDAETLSMYFPNSTFAPHPRADMWSGIAPSPFPLPNQPFNPGAAYPPPCNTFLTPAYSPPPNTTPPILTAPYPERSFTQPTSPSPAFQHSPGSPMLPGDHQPDGIRLSTWVGKYESQHHQPLALETGPFKK
jgi:hypothetical protein